MLNEKLEKFVSKVGLKRSCRLNLLFFNLLGNVMNKNAM